MRVRSVAAIPILVGFPFSAAGCGDPASPPGPPEWRLAAEPVVELGAPDDGAGSGPPIDAPAEPSPGILFTRIAGAAALADGRYVVADAGEGRLVVVAADGAVEAVVGRAGEGPGEFERISNLWATADGGWAVWDSGLRRVTRFAADGSVRESHPVTFGPEGSPVTGGNLDQGQGGLADGRFVVGWIVAGGMGDAGGPPRDTPLPDRMVYGLFGPDGAFLRLVGQDEGMIRHYSEAGGGPLPLSPFPWAVLVGDTLVTTNGAPARLRFFGSSGIGGAPDGGDGAPAPDRLLDLDLEASSREAAWAALEEALAAGRLPELWVDRVEGIDRGVGPIPALGRLLVDDEGRLWARTYEPARDALALGGGPFRTGGEWTVFARHGTRVARIALPDDLAPLAVAGDRMLALRRDALDVERFVVTRIER